MKEARAAHAPALMLLRPELHAAYASMSMSMLGTRPQLVGVFLWTLAARADSLEMQPIICCVRAQSARGFVTEFSGGATPHTEAVCRVPYFSRDYPGILIVLISFWSGMG